VTILRATIRVKKNKWEYRLNEISYLRQLIQYTESSKPIKTILSTFSHFYISQSSFVALLALFSSAILDLAVIVMNNTDGSFEEAAYI